MAHAIALARAGVIPGRYTRFEVIERVKAAAGTGQPPGLRSFDTGHAKPCVYALSRAVNWSCQDAVSAGLAAAPTVATTCGAGAVVGTATRADSAMAW